MKLKEIDVKLVFDPKKYTPDAVKKIVHGFNNQIQCGKFIGGYFFDPESENPALPVNDLKYMSHSLLGIRKRGQEHYCTLKVFEGVYGDDLYSAFKERKDQICCSTVIYCTLHYGMRAMKGGSQQVDADDIDKMVRVDVVLEPAK